MAEDRFQDFTVATGFERFCAAIEKALYSWLPKGQSLDAVRQRAPDVSEEGCGLVCLRTAVLHRLPFRSEAYTLTLHLPTAAQQPCSQGAQPARAAALQWWPAAAGPEQRLHRLQRWFGTAAFLTLVPQSYSGRVLAASSEGQTLLSGLAVALSNCRVAWPAFLPVHDALRDAVAGVVAVGRTSVFLHADGMPAIRAAKQPPELLQVEGQLAAFAEQVGASAPQAAAACREVLASGGAAAGREATHSIGLSARRSYRMPEHGTDGDDGSEHDAMTVWVDDWDVGAPWLPWASYSDPIAGLELDLSWHGVPAAVALQQPGTAWAPATASGWRLHVLAPQQQSARSIFALQASERKREHLALPLPEAYADQQQPSLAASAPEGSFASMARSLLPRLPDASRAKAIGQLASAEWWEARGLTVPRAPPDAALTDVMRDLFAAMALPPSFGGAGGGSGGVGGALGSLGTGVGAAAAAAAGILLRQHHSSSSVASQGAAAGSDRDVSPTEAFARLSRTAPSDSLLARLALHALVFGNLRAVAILWGRFVRELRFSHWETLTPLPRMPGGASGAAVLPDLGACLLQQKLQMVALCISRRAASRKSGATTPTLAAGTSKRWQLPLHVPSERADTAGLESLDGWDADDLTLNGSSTPNGRLSHASSDAATVAAAAATPASMQTTPRGNAHPADMLSPRSGASHYSSASEGGFSNADGPMGSKGGTPHAVSTKCGSQEGRIAQIAGGNRAIGPERMSASPQAMAEMDQAAPPADLLQRVRSWEVPAPQSNAVAAQAHWQQQLQLQQQQQPADALVTGLDVCSDPDAAAVGVAGHMADGQCLLHHPARVISIPQLQEGQATTEDMQLEVEAALSSLGEGEGGREVRARLSTPGLASDMAAFKAANPGACLGDFLRWHSPRDWLPDPPPGRLSSRMAHPGNAWAALWAAAPATPAAAQPPLMDAEAEGERALHGLETAPPGAALRQLLAVALSAAASALAAAPAAALPTPAAALRRLADHMASAFEAAELGAEGFGGRRRAGIGAEDARAAAALAPLLPLLDHLARVERLLVAGESLLRRLPGQSALVERVLVASLPSTCSQQPQQLPAAASDQQLLFGTPPQQAAPLLQDVAPPDRPASAPLLRQSDPGDVAQPEQPTPPVSAPSSAPDAQPYSQPGSLAVSSRSSSQELLQPMPDAQPPAQNTPGTQQQPQQPALQQPPEAAAVTCGVEVAAPDERQALAQLMHGGGGGAGNEDDVAEWGDCLDSETVIEAVPVQQQSNAAAPPPHRLYVQATPTSMRLATIVACED